MRPLKRKSESENVQTSLFTHLPQPEERKKSNKKEKSSIAGLDLEEIEVRLSQLLAKSRSDWTEMAKLTLSVQQNKLYKQGGFSSFSAWVRQLAVENEREPSLLWRFIKAAKYFLKLSGSEDLELVNEAVKIAPEALEKLEKVQRQAPTPVFESLKERVFSGDVTVAECRRIEKDYRPPLTEARTNRGRPSKGEEGKIDYLGKWKEETVQGTLLPDEGKKPISSIFTHSQIKSTIQRALKVDYNWMQKCTGMKHPPRNTGTHPDVTIQGGDGKRLELDFVGVVRWSLKIPKDLFVVEVKSSLDDLEVNNNWREYLAYSNYFCLACPLDNPKLLKAIKKISSQFEFIGILGVDFSDKLNDFFVYPIQVIKRPEHHQGNKITSIYETLYERVLGWSVPDPTILDEDESED